MKKTFVTALLLSVFSIGCKKNQGPDLSKTYKGFVLYSECSVSVVQTIGPDYLGTATWAAGSYAGAPVYHNVFTVQNGCQFLDTMGTDTFNFKIISPQVQNCMHCMMVVDAPDVSYPIEVVN